jgi:hypothetical protein
LIPIAEPKTIIPPGEIHLDFDHDFDFDFGSTLHPRPNAKPCPNATTAHSPSALFKLAQPNDYLSRVANEFGLFPTATHGAVSPAQLAVGDFSPPSARGARVLGAFRFQETGVAGGDPERSGAVAPMMAVMPPASDASADAAQKPKRARTSKPKVKTGCNNCK